jgi:hypothetical protein
MKYAMSLSGGVASAVAADRAIGRYGKEDVILWFADTKWEDADLYRFMADCLTRWGMKQETYTDGRTPLEVAEHKQLIPNSKVAPCSFILKVEPFRAFIAKIPGAVTVLLGLDWKEMHRMEAPTKAYEAIGAQVDFPLMWKPYEYRPYQDVVRHDWGIEPPRLYKLGYPHNNCAGRCVKQGVHEWIRTLIHFPARFEEMKNWEQAQREKGGPRANRTICREEVNGEKRPITLAEIERRFLAGEYREVPSTVFEEYKDDRVSCFCSYA